MNNSTKTTSIASISVENITKRFGRTVVLDSISCTARLGTATAVVGDNGSGKSTFMKILLGVVSAEKGSITWNDTNGAEIPTESRTQHIGFVSPYLTLYDEFTPLELMKHCAGMRGGSFHKDASMQLLSSMQLDGVERRVIGAFSSGMKQRMKYVLALQHNPSVLMLDEPMANLDVKGIDCVEQVIQQALSNNRIVLIATNDERDIALCSSKVSVMGKQ